MTDPGAPRRQRVLLAAGLAAALALLAHAPLALGIRQLFYDDNLRFDVPLTQLAADALCHARLPLWNPYVGVGTPLITDPSAQPIWPGKFLACALPAGHALGLMLVLQLALLAAGAAAVARDAGACFAIAVGAGVALAIAGPSVSWLTSPAYLTTLSFFPWTLFWARRLGLGRPRAVLGLGLSIGLQALGGDVPGTLFASLVAVVLWHAARRDEAAHGPQPTLAGALARLALAGVIALLVGAGTWMPLLWFLGRSGRGGGIAVREAAQWSTHPAELLGLLWPNPMGLPLPHNTFWPFRWVGDRLFVHSIYVGATLAGFGLWGALRRGADRFVRCCAAAALVLALVASGGTTPLWTLTRHIFVYFRYPSKLIPYAVVLLGLAGAVALSRALAARRSASIAASLIAAFCLLGAAIGPWIQGVVALRSGAPAEVIVAAGSALRADCLRAALIAGAFAGLFFLWQRRPVWSDARVAAFAGVLLVADAVAAGSQLDWTVPAPTVARPRWLPEVAPWGPRVLRSATLNTVKIGLDIPSYRAEQDRALGTLLPQVNVQLRTGSLFGYGLQLEDPARRLAALYDADGLALAEVTGCDLALSKTPRPLRWVARGLTEGRLVTLIEAAPLLVQSVVRPLPRLHLADGGQVVAAGAETPLLLAGAARNGPIVTAGDILMGGTRVSADAGATAGLPPPGEPVAAVVASAWWPEGLDVEVDRSRAGLLVIMDAFADGWRAFVDGAEVPILRANIVGRALAVPAGQHRVSLRFAPPALVVPPLVSWISAAAGLLGLLAPRRSAKARG